MSQHPHHMISHLGLMNDKDIMDVLDHVPSPFALVSADTELNVLYLNQAFTRTFGYSLNDLRTVPDWIERVYADPVFREQRISSWQQAVDHAIQHQAPIPDRESHLRCKDDTYRDVIIHTALLHHLLLITFTDITESKRLASKLLESEKQFRSFVENANDIIYTLDLEGRFTYLSPNYQKIFGVKPEDLVGKPFAEVLHPDDLPASFEAYASVLQGDRLTDIVYRVRHHDGRWLWQSSNISPILDESGKVGSVIGVGRDIHANKLTEEKQRLSEARYRLLSDNARDVIWTISPDGRITYVSPSVEHTRGYTPHEAMHQSIDQILTPDSVAINLKYLMELQSDLTAKRAPKSFRGEMEYRCKDGSTYWCDVMATPILAEDGSLIELLGVSRDISEHKRYQGELKKAKESTEALNRALEAANQRLNRMATTDTLTKLWNRRFIEDRLAHEISMAGRYGHPVSLLMFDIDHFKVVNDTYGHVAGDRVLVALSDLTRRLIRATDYPCRWGGEEFMILMPNTTSTETMSVAEKLRQSIAQLHIPEVGTVTASFGAATYRPNESIDDWINRADTALYEAKHGGRNTVRVAPD